MLPPVGSTSVAFHFTWQPGLAAMLAVVTDGRAAGAVRCPAAPGGSAFTGTPESLTARYLGR
jgi:hypothetical protein